MADTIEVGGRTVTFKRGLSKPGKSRMVLPSAIWDELTLAERESIAGSGSNKCKGFLWTLALSASIRRGEVRTMLQRLEDAAFLDAGRTADIIDALR